MNGSLSLAGTQTSVQWPVLAAGALTGESLRVGTPSHRLESRLSAITALLNAPPSHRDIINSQVYDLRNSNSSASYQANNGTTTSTTVTAKSDWKLSTEGSITAGDPEGTHVTASLGASYGQSFSKVNGSSQSFQVSSTYTASVSDTAVYTQINYDVWEYPILNSAGTATGAHLTVLFPRAAPLVAGTSGSTCDTWYTPDHVVNNVWSYPSIDMGTAGFTDFDRQIYTNGVGSDQSFALNWNNIASQERTSQIQHEISAGIETQIGGDKVSVLGSSFNVPWSVKFSINGSYGNENITTQGISVDQSTQISGNFAAQPPSRSYQVQPYVYWAKGGYLTLDYLTQPGSNTFWSLYNKPDPAFALPWFGFPSPSSPEPPPCGADRQRLTRDIRFSATSAAPGDVITVTAKIRNFSGIPASDVLVRFYQGDPRVGGALIGAQTIAQLPARGAATVSVPWTAGGQGVQRIYVQINANGAVVEMHGAGDPMDNNLGYNEIDLGGGAFVDPGAADSFGTLIYQRPAAVGRAFQIGLHIPTQNLPDNRVTLFKLSSVSVARAPAVGDPFTITAYSAAGNPVDGFSLRKSGQQPALVTIRYDAADVAGEDVSQLTLWALQGSSWVPAACGDVLRMPQSGMLAVPVCTTGTFAVLRPSAAINAQQVFLPLVLR